YQQRQPQRKVTQHAFDVQTSPPALRLLRVNRTSGEGERAGIEFAGWAKVEVRTLLAAARLPRQARWRTLPTQALAANTSQRQGSSPPSRAGARPGTVAPAICEGMSLPPVYGESVNCPLDVIYPLVIYH